MNDACRSGRVSTRAAAWLIFGAVCAGVPVGAYIFVIVVAPVWVLGLVLLATTDAMSAGLVAAQVALCALVFYGVSRLAAFGIRHLPERAQAPALAAACIAALLPLGFRSYALCYTNCQHLSIGGLMREIQPG